MLKQVEGSAAVAEAVALCRPEVVCAYPITPQTHIVEGLGAMVKAGKIDNCEYINVESEFAALSVAIGSSAAGARSYTATASQGLLFMCEAVYSASGMGLPIVMTLGNRAIGAPINIWNDQSDAMNMRDAGWIQLFAENNQEAADLHIQAFYIAEALSCPVMVCVDGFILTHAVEEVDVPTQEEVDAFLPPFTPIQELDYKNPLTIGAIVGPDLYTEVRYLEHKKQLRAYDVIKDVSIEFKKHFGRDAGGMIRSYKADDAETIIVAMGSVIGTLKDMIDEKRKEGEKIGLISVCSFRPFPDQDVAQALSQAKHIIVLEKSLAVGQGGVMAMNVKQALKHKVPVTTLIAGLGGRPIPKKSLAAFVEKMKTVPKGDLHVLDLNERVIEEQLAEIEAYDKEQKAKWQEMKSKSKVKTKARRAS